MLKKILSIILIIIGIYILLVFLKPGTTDFIESHFGSKFSMKLRAFKEVVDGKKTIKDFKQYIFKENPNFQKYYETIDKNIYGVKKSIDSIRKKALDTQKIFDENIGKVEKGIQKLEKTKKNLEEIGKILNTDNQNEIKQEKKDEIKNKNVDEKITKELEKKIQKDFENKEIKETKQEKIEYEIMGDINDF